MKYELHELELIPVSLQPRNLNGQKDKQAFISKCVNETVIEVKRITDELLHNITKDNSHAATYYIQQHQYGIVNIMDSVFRFLDCKDENGISYYPKLLPFRDQYQLVLAHLDSLLQTLEIYLSSYFDHEMIIPSYSRMKRITNTELLINQVRGLSADQKLLKIICLPLQQILNNELSAIDLSYIKKYRKKLEKLLEEEATITGLHDFLLQVNFNAHESYRYFVQHFNEEALENGLHIYYNKLKLIRQTIKNDVSFDRTLPALHEQLITWLVEEIAFLEKQQQISGQISQDGKVTKVETGLSVSQLSLLIKLLIDTGILKNISTAELTNLVARHFSTANCETISEGSLRKKVYNIEQSSVKSMNDVLMGLVNEVRKY